MESSDTSNSVEKRKPADLFKAYVEYMKLMLGNLFIINAGSATALIAFFGNIKPEGSASQLVTPVSVKNAVAFYAFGAAFAIAAAAAAAVLENDNSSRLEKKRDLRSGYGFVTVFLILASGFCFLAASLLATQVWGPWL